MRTNAATKAGKIYTHEGATAFRVGAAQQLQRSVMSCMLFEKEFYEDGQEIADRIAALVPQVSPETVSDMAIRARTDMKLRHVPLLLCSEMAKYPAHRALLKTTVYQVIQRADELAEILAIYSRGRTGTRKLNKLSKQLRLGIAAAFTKFSEYDLAKYNRDNAIKLRDVLFVTHATPKDAVQAKLWKKLIDGTLEIPDTWEVAISAAKPEEKAATWKRLLVENKLGALALLRNLRNMQEAKIPDGMIETALRTMKTERVLPFRFITAARYAPTLEPALEAAMFKCVADAPKFEGRNLIVIDHSGSMDGKLSAKSEMTRFEAAAALAILMREVCPQFGCLAFSDDTKVVPPRRGFALRDSIAASMSSGGTNTGMALQIANKAGYDRIIVITDEQSHERIPDPLPGVPAYFINVASHKNGIGYGKWRHLDGFSEAVLDYIRQTEAYDLELKKLQ